MTMPSYKWWEEQERLWDELVPPRGQAPTVQGELVRCIGKLTDEAYRNGNLNWAPGSRHELMLSYVENTLLEGATFPTERQAAIRRDIEAIRDYQHPNTGGHGTCYYNVTEAVVDWCVRHPKLIAHESVPELHR